MRSLRTVLALVAGVSLSGCGTYVPAIYDSPGDDVGNRLFVQAIVTNVTCEIQDAINDVIREDIQNVRDGVFGSRRTAWLDSWGVLMTLNLTVSERSSFNPVVNVLPPSPADAIFNIAASANASAEATRIDKMGSYYTVQELVAANKCSRDSRGNGPFMLQSDLKLKEWIRSNIQFEGTGVAKFPGKMNGPLKQDVISHQVKFEVVTNGTVSPGLRLARAQINQSGTLFGAGRTRTHTLIVTLGPAEVAGEIVLPGPAGPQIVAGRRALVQRAVASDAVRNSHLASEIGVAVRSNLQ